MDSVPIANDRKDQQNKGDHEQAGRFGSIGRVLVMLVRLFGFARKDHRDIVARTNSRDTAKSSICVPSC